MKLLIALILLSLLSPFAFADPPDLPVILTRESYGGFHGSVKTVTLNGAMGEMKDGQWAPAVPYDTAVILEFDTAGRLAKNVLKSPNGEQVESYSYDPTGRLLSYQMQQNPKSLPVVDIPIPISKRTIYSYDAQGRIQKMTDETEYAAQPGVKVMTAIDYTCDAQGRMTEARESSGQEGVTVITRWSYDVFGREILCPTVDGKGVKLFSRTTTYLANEAKTTETIKQDNDGKLLSSSIERFDAQGRSIELTSKTKRDRGMDEQHRVTTYTGSGQTIHGTRTLQGDLMGSQESTIYLDGQGRPLFSYSTNAGGVQSQLTYAYDSHGNTVLSTNVSRPYRPNAPFSWKQVVSPALTSYIYDQFDNWTVRYETRPVIDGKGDPVIENGMPKMKYSKDTREITYFEK